MLQKNGSNPPILIMVMNVLACRKVVTSDVWYSKGLLATVFLEVYELDSIVVTAVKGETNLIYWPGR